MIQSEQGQDVAASEPLAAVRPEPKVSPWVKVMAVGALVTPAVLTTAMIVDWRRHVDAQLKAASDFATLERDIQAVRDEVRVGNAVSWVATRDVISNCHAFNDRFECSVTNVKDQPVAACWVGKLAQKEGGGSMSSTPLCTGRVGPRETLQVSVPWSRGHAKDICSSSGRFGPELDFSVCEFSAQSFDPPASASPQ